MIFRYRYVPFGTVFASKQGYRDSDEDENERASLYANEIAVDIGGVCWGYAGEELSIIDHHFSRPEQIPSASAAVLHNAQRIWDRFHGFSGKTFWLVTHLQPDFDAFCSMYMARSILEDAGLPIDWKSLGVSPEGWVTVLPDTPRKRKIEWFNPDLRNIPADQRWRVLLAANASVVDNSRRMLCPRTRALHSVLYAALKRGREYESNGAVEFFEHVQTALQSGKLNPLIDSVLESDVEFAPELAMLDREEKAYDLDLRKARKAIVHLPKLQGDFNIMFSALKSSSLLEDGFITRPEHLLPDQPRNQADGIYIRDPECLLFKEWARLDLENSSMGAGFLFTAVAYSGGRPNALVNQSDYVIAIDPERAGGCHLYGVWARLQTAEIKALHEPKHQWIREKLEQAEARASATHKRTNARLGFEDRAGKYKALFDDPWFDGSNYECTIVAAPARGTFIAGTGLRHDLLDDPVLEVVRTELEYTFYSSQASITDFPANRVNDKSHEFSVEMSAAVPLAARGHFRLGSVRLQTDVNLTVTPTAIQIGTALWRILEPDRQGIPSDFSSRHLLAGPNWLGVWNRRGLVVAYKQGAEHEIAEIKQCFRELVTLARDVDLFINANSADAKGRARTSESLILRAIRLEHSLVLPENRLLGRFFEAIGLHELLKTLREINFAAADNARNEMIALQTGKLTRHTATVADVQTKVEWLEVFFVGFYATELSRIITELLGLTAHIALIVIVSVGFTFTLAAALALAPWRHSGSKKLSTVLGLLAILWLMALFLKQFIPQNWIDP